MSDLIIRPEHEELIATSPARMTMNLTSPRALEINDDQDWLRARILLGSLFRKYGKFLVEVNEIGKYA